MLGRILLSLCLLCFLSGIVRAASLPVEAVKPAENDSHEPRAVKVLREWSATHRNCTAVQGKLLRIGYNDVFERQKHAAGEFSYLGPRRGFWKWSSPARRPNEESLKRSRRGGPYEYEDAEPEAWYWLTDRLLRIDESEKTVEFYRIPQGSVKYRLLDFGAHFRTVDRVLPLMPGMPDKQRLETLIQGCLFKVLRENETHIWIAGKPKNRRLATTFQEFKLYLEKSPWRLKAIQVIHPGGNQSNVYVFSEVSFDPQEWDEPDLTGYKQYDLMPEEPVEWPVEARYPETLERGPVEARRPEQPEPAFNLFLNPALTLGFALWELIF